MINRSSRVTLNGQLSRVPAFATVICSHAKGCDNLVALANQKSIVTRCERQLRIKFATVPWRTLSGGAITCSPHRQGRLGQSLWRPQMRQMDFPCCFLRSTSPSTRLPPPSGQGQTATSSSIRTSQRPASASRASSRSSAR